MKANIKTILLIIVAIVTTNIVSAQEGRPQGPPPIPSDKQIKEMVTELSKELSLADEQEEKVSDLYFDHYEKVAEQQELNKAKKGEGREAMQKLNKELEDSVNDLLTEDQQKIYESYLKQQQSKRDKKGRPEGDRPKQQ